jgi:hypothetical protein
MHQLEMLMKEASVMAKQTWLQIEGDHHRLHYSNSEQIRCDPVTSKYTSVPDISKVIPRNSKNNTRSYKEATNNLSQWIGPSQKQRR